VNTTADIIIVGAGIVGAACAAACAQHRLRVLVLDRGPVGGGATAAGMGHLVAMDDSPEQFALTAYSRRLWHELAPHLPRDVEFEPCGTLWVAADDDEMAEVRRKERRYREEGLRVEVLDRQALAQAEPNLAPDLVGALRVPEDAVLYPPCAARFLLEHAASVGGRIEVRPGTEVTSLGPDGTVTVGGHTKLHANTVVNAAGAWSTSLSPRLPIRPRKGHLVITDRYPGYVHHQIVELGYLKSAHAVAADSVAFNIQPRKTGQLLLGSSRQFDADSTVVEPPILQRMINRAERFLPALPNLLALRCWTGHRAATPDKRPLIGPSLDSERIWLATGHEGLGITTSLATGQILADLILQRPPEISAVPYLPARFAQTANAHV
jgi:D-hydroxyproline dehydrogenase subunit beta